MKIRMLRSRAVQLVCSGLLILALVHPGSTALASETGGPVAAQNSVTASAVIVPAHTARLGLLLSGMARDVPVKEGDSVKAGQTLLVLDTPELEFAVIEARAALRSAEAYAELQKYRRVENRRNGKVFYDVVPAVVRQRADARVQQARVALELAQISLAEGTLTAPFDGVVTSLSVIPGEFVPSDQAVVTLATLNALQVETTDLSERDIARIKPGAPARIHVDALDQTFSGRVTGLTPIANIVGGDVVFKVTVAFEPRPAGLLWGMTAEVTIGE